MDKTINTNHDSDAVTVDFRCRDELCKCWFVQMLDNEIEDTEGTIYNERLAEKGSRNDDEAAMHTNNIAVFEQYVDMLKNTRKQTYAAINQNDLRSSVLEMAANNGFGGKTKGDNK